MTYFEFHLVFLLPAIAVLMCVQPRRLADAPARWLGLGLIAAIAFAYTIPWDNYLVWKQVWGYGAERVLATVGYVPVEEYLFFLLQSVLTGLWLYFLIGKAPLTSPREAHVQARINGSYLYLALAIAGVLCLAAEQTLYLGLILVWAGPMLLVQWLYGGHHLWHRRRLWFAAVMVPTAYLWVADRIAIGLDIWYISPRYSTGLMLFGLPVEEAVFFLVTNLLVVQGLILALPVLHEGRVRSLIRLRLQPADLL